jgi:hypothetical protein
MIKFKYNTTKLPAHVDPAYLLIHIAAFKARGGVITKCPTMHVGPSINPYTAAPSDHASTSGQVYVDRTVIDQDGGNY